MVSSSMAMAAVAGWGRNSYTTPNTTVKILRLQTRPPPALPRSPLLRAAPGNAQQSVRGGRNGFLVSISSSSSSSCHATRGPYVFSGTSPPFGRDSRKKTASSLSSSSSSSLGRLLISYANRVPKLVKTSLILVIGAFLVFFVLSTWKPPWLPPFPVNWVGGATAAALIWLGILLVFVRFELVPYTERWHVVPVPSKLERMWGAVVFDKQMEEYQAEILPPEHPQSLQVRNIFHKIVGVMEEELGLGGKGAPASQGPRRVATRHLQGLNWEVTVIDRDKINAFAIPGGKIIVFRGILDELQSDTEIATVLGHEIAHVVGRHAAERIGHAVFALICQLVLMKVFKVDLTDLSDVWKYLLLHPFSRRLEKEADSIGLLLSSAAGYDPRIAPEIYKSLGDRSRLADYLSTHPSGPTRAESVSEEAFMKKAIHRYEERIKLLSNETSI